MAGNRTRVAHELRDLARRPYFEAWDEEARTVTCTLAIPPTTDNGGGDRRGGGGDRRGGDATVEPYAAAHAGAYAERSWTVSLHLPADYPFKSPSVGFVDRIFHPNVDLASGSVCLNALGSDWTPLYNLRTVVEQLLPQLVRYPNPDDPLNEEAAALLLAQDVEGYVQRARATGPGRPTPRAE